MPFPFLFEEPERKVARKARNERPGDPGVAANTASLQLDDERNAAAWKAVRPARPNRLEAAFRIPKMSGQRG